jgi:hypothetical protein
MLEVIPMIGHSVVDFDQTQLLQPQPGKKVRVMFPVGQQDDISRFEFKAQGYHIDSMGRIESEDDLFFRSRIDKFSDRLACSLDPFFNIPFDAIGHLFCKPVVASPTAAGGIIRIILVDGCNNLPRDQRRAGIVQIDGWLFIPPSFQ